MVKIGVAVPCYVGHLDRLFDLLDSIQNQTIHPTRVVVSSSSTPEKKIDIEKYKKYTFELVIHTTEEKRNAAQNRNRSASELSDMDLITFIDADDVMSPQRIEILLKVFHLTQYDMAVHNFSYTSVPFEPITHIEYDTNTLEPCPSGCIRHKDHSLCGTYPIHHSQSTIKKAIFDLVQYPEEQDYCRREDSIFCNRVLSLANVKHVYINHRLSYYDGSGSLF